MKGMAGKYQAREMRGAMGEEVAAHFLESRGFRVLARNWRYRQLELDLVCQDGEDLVFVEVKTRGRGSMGTPHDGLDATKRERLGRAAARYLSATDNWEVPCRFDLVAVTENESGKVDVEHIENAFDLSGMRWA